MKIAVFDPIGNWGGGSRFVRALLIAIKYRHPESHITYFGNACSIQREALFTDFKPVGINVIVLTSLNNSFYNKLLKALSGSIAKLPKSLEKYFLPSAKISKEIAKAAGSHDIAFFPWPYLVDPPNLSCPVVAVFHDFNYKYFFGAKTYSDQQRATLDKQIPKWLTKSTAIVSSEFISGELRKFYPKISKKIHVIPVAPFSLPSAADDDTALATIHSLKINQPYILYPTNLASHKNLGPLLKAMYLLRNRNVDIKLVLTGPGTQEITAKSSQFGCEFSNFENDVIGLGYVTNKQIDALIKCATAVISTSLYEAGNGPGLEAWLKGTPVIMSNIPSFIEHLDTLKVRAQLIDPYNADEISRKIKIILDKKESVMQDTIISKMNISKYTWDIVADKYYMAFTDAINAYLTDANKRLP